MSVGHRLRVDQSAEFAELLSILRSQAPGGAVILGGAGMGKTSLVQAALSRPDVPVPVLRLHCTPALAAMPYGALSPYLSSLEKIEEPIQVLREINIVLETGRDGAGIPIVLIEDAHFLDPESSFVLSLLVENAAIKLIAIGSGRIEGDSTLFSLTESGLLSTLVVQPFDTAGVRFLAQELTEGVLTEGAVEAIEAMTGGNPSFVKAFVQSCLDQGVLARDGMANPAGTQQGGKWILTRLSPEPDEGLIELVRETHASLTTSQQRIVELMALGGRQAPALLLASGGVDYRHLVESGILLVDRDGMIQLRAEIHAVVLRHVIAPGHRAELYHQWVGHRVELGMEPTPLQVLWGVEVGADVGADDVMTAVETANNQLDHTLAWKLCAVAEISRVSERGSLLEARTLIGLGRYYSARSILMGLAEKAEDPLLLQRTVNMLFTIAVYLSSEQQDLDELEILWQARSRQSNNQRGFARAAAEHQAVNDLMSLWRKVQHSSSGPETIVESERLLANPALPVEGCMIALLILSDLHSVKGNTETALGLARQAMSKLDLDPKLAGTYQLSVIARIGWNLEFSGRYAEAEEFLAAHRGTTARLGLHRHGSLSMIRGIGQMLQGQTNLARHSLGESMAEFQVNDPARLLPLAATLKKFADQRSMGMIPSSPGLQVASTYPADDNSPDLLGGAVPHHSLLARAVARGTATALESVENYPLLEREVLVGAPQRSREDGREAGGLAERLFELSRTMEGGRARFLARMTDPDNTQDPGAAEILAAEAQEAGEFHVASELLARAAFQYSGQGDGRRCGAIVRQLMQLVRDHQLVPDAFVARALALAELTRREEEIVDLARQGNNNAEIARSLTVSQRTVEGHLYRVFSKLGITDRTELKGIRLDAGTGRGQNA